MYTPRDRRRYARRIEAYENSDVWRARAARFRRHHGNVCQACGATPVDVHHRSYKRAFFGNEPDSDLRALCRADHRHVHDLTRLGWTLADATDHVVYQRRHYVLIKWGWLFRWVMLGLAALWLVWEITHPNG